LVDFKVKVVFTNLHGLYVTMNNVLYVSSATLNLCDTDDELAVLITHEISHLLLDHKPRELRSYFVQKYIIPSSKSNKENESNLMRL